ncbi:hypothetical protein GCM10022207_82130 [Streptomyces lannensis]|uniref:Uncharacterized protein n=1 Tax=Streptomyces lannensis TaxID=766498 RepID=A0ABP7LJY0_9ACTN
MALGETQLSHSGLTAAQAFRDDSSEGVRLLARPEYGRRLPTRASVRPLMACLLLHFGMQAFNGMKAGQPWTATLDCIGREVGPFEDERPVGS